MRIIALTDLRKRAKSRPSGYVDDILSRATLVTETHYHIEEAVLAELRKKYTSPPAGPVSVRLVRTIAPVHPLACVHRGEQIGERVCPTCCGGHVRAKVHACELHGPCTMFGQPIPGVKQCHSCVDRKAPEGG